jgi:hypothetical protein
MPGIITLLTDFGTRDSYVAEVKGVIATKAHGVVLIDVTHDLAPGDLPAARYLLARTWHRFPAGTVHLAVVDPGVGTARRAIAAEAGGHYFVAPDNGLLSPLPRDARFVELPVPEHAAPTFHARDVFAPVAAQLTNGTALTHLGQVIHDPERVAIAGPRRDGAVWVGEVVYVDRFGTLMTNIPGELVRPGVGLRVGERDVGAVRLTFGDVAPGQLVSLVGSNGSVEIAVREGSAAELLGVGVGVEVRA